MASKGKRYEGIEGAWIWQLTREHWNLLLAPHADFMASLGIQLDDDGRNDGWVIRVHSALLAHEADLPAALAEVFAHVIPLSNEKVGDEFRQLVEQHKLDLGVPVKDLTDAELALRFYLQHRSLFMVVYAHAQTSEPSVFAEFFDPSRSSFEGRATDETKRVFCQELGLHMKSKERTGFAEVTHYDKPKEHSFLVVHGDTLKSVGRIDPETMKRSQLRFNPDRHTTILIEKGTGRLSINSAHQADVDALKQLVGRVFYRNPNQFSASAVYTGEPLLNPDVDALSVEGIAGLEKVTLLSCTIGESVSRRRRRTVTFAASNLAVDLELVRTTAGLFGADHVDSMKLSLKLVGVKREVPVNIRCNNERTKLSVGKREKLDVVYRFLAARGFSKAPTWNLAKAA